MAYSRVGTSRQRLTAGLAFLAMVLAGLSQGPAGAQLSEVTGSAFGFSANVSLFGAPQRPAGPEPTVTLPSGGGEVTDTQASGEAVFGPARLFESGELTVGSQGTTGPDGSVASFASVLDVGPGPFTADEVSSECVADEEGFETAVTILNGVVEGVEGGAVDVPENPEPGTAYEGVVAGANDRFRIVFNEVVEDDDSATVTVNAVHVFLLGPTATGDLIIGQSVCGIGVGDPTPAPPAGEDPTTGEPSPGERPKAPPATPTGAQPKFTG